MSDKSIKTDLVEQLAEILDDKNLTEIEYDTETFRVRVARDVCTASVAPAAMAAPVAVSNTAAPNASAPAEDSFENHPGAVKAPMVGVVYVAPEPGAAPYAGVGDTVSAGQTLFLIEAMKTFNPVKAPKAGKITHILVEDGQPVEYDEPLVIVE